MRRCSTRLLLAVLVGAVCALPATAQTLEEICPGADEGTGALWGAVVDADGDMVLPGATVVVSWKSGNQDRTAEARVAMDGSYRVCHLPLETPISVYAMFATVEGESTALTMTEVFTRHDLAVAMTTGVAGEDDRLWMCINGGESQINAQFSRLVRCDDSWQPLERCPKVELGRITVQPVGAGSGMLREMIEQLVQEANRIGANAVVNVQDNRGGTSFGATLHLTSITAEGVRIEVDPSTCA